jgi:hypothetical protein
MPDQMLTKAEHDCCQQMAQDCGAPNMPHACCRTVVRTDVGITAKVARGILPPIDAPADTMGFVLVVPAHSHPEFPVRYDHAPPPEFRVSSSVLRI